MMVMAMLLVLMSRGMMAFRSAREVSCQLR